MKWREQQTSAKETQTFPAAGDPQTLPSLLRPDPGSDRSCVGKGTPREGPSHLHPAAEAGTEGNGNSHPPGGFRRLTPSPILSPIWHLFPGRKESRKAEPQRWVQEHLCKASRLQGTGSQRIPVPRFSTHPVSPLNRSTKRNQAKWSLRVLEWHLNGN